MHLSDFLCASLDECSIPGLREQKKSDAISKLNLQNLAIFMAKCGKFGNFLWQNLAIFVAKFGISNGNFPRCQFKFRDFHLPNI